MTPAELRVVVDLAVRDGRSVVRSRSCHAMHGRAVHIAATAGGRARVRTVDVGEWPDELARVCRTPPPDDVAPPPPLGAELPWDLVVGTGAALAAHRPDHYAELLARTDECVREQVGRLHLATVGRLRAVGTVPGRRVGWVSWVLVADGWRALSPYSDRTPGHRRAMVRLEPRRPEDLAHEVARWATGVAR
jgi:hypothetical protein